MTSILAAPMALHQTPYGHNFSNGMVEALGSVVDDPDALLAGSKTRRMSPIHRSDLDILSATTYPIALAAATPCRNRDTAAPIRSRIPKSRRTNSSRPLYGGLVLDADQPSPTPVPAAEVEPATRRKARRRKRPSDDEDDGNDSGRHKQGRPRLATQDETAADRRRTQIRLAQRAYRHRKETTISELKQKVEEMERTVAEMNTMFRCLHNNFLESGVILANAALTKQLNITADLFACLVEKSISCPDPDPDAEVVNEARLQRWEKPAGGSTILTTHGMSGALPMPQDYKTRCMQVDDAIHELGQGHTDTVMTDSDAGIVLDRSWTALTKNGTEEITVEQIHAALSEDTIDWTDVRTNIERPLNTDERYTYSFQETSFARRLNRLCIEHGYRILTSSEANPAHVGRIFKFTFCLFTRERVARRFQELLKRTAGESLENGDQAYVHIGGAGTHYPRRNDFGNAVFPTDTVTTASVLAPRRLISADTPCPEQGQGEMLENLGYSGDWFDSHDVEQYLRTKGLFLDGHSSFADIDTELISLPPLSDWGSVSSTRSTSANTPDQWSGVQSSSISRGSDETIVRHGYPPVQHQTSAYNNVNTILESYSWLDAMSSGQQAEAEWFDGSGEGLCDASPTAKLVTLDVTKFLTRLVHDAATCLGRAPGFRKEQVDIALALCLQEAS